jgi:hypothetical protein
MVNSDSSQEVFKTSAEALARIMNLDEPTAEGWNERDLAAMVRHQMSAPLNFDLTSIELKATKAEARNQTLTGAANKRIQSFEELLFHREPALELLRLSKEFFKRRVKDCTKDSPEWQVAYLFYLLSILAAGTRTGQLSKLAPGEMCRAIRWALDQPWADAKTKELLSQAYQRLQVKGDD